MVNRFRLLGAFAALACLFTIPTSSYADEATDQIGNYRKEGVDVVQGRIFKKGGRHEFSFDLGMIPDNQFLFYEQFQGRYTYHFREAIGFELSGAYVTSQERNILGDLQNFPCDSANPIFDGSGNLISNCGLSLNPPADPIKGVFLGSIVWSPIYGKFALFSKKIFHFDLYMLAGAGLFHTAAHDRFGFNVGVGMKVFVNQWMAVRFDIRNLTVREGAPFDQISNNRSFNLGVSAFLPTKSKGK